MRLVDGRSHIGADGSRTWRAPARAVETLSVHRHPRDAGFVLATAASDEHRRNAIPKNRDRGMARYPPLIGTGFLYGGPTAAYRRHRRPPESRTDKKHRTEFAPLLVQELGSHRIAITGQ